MFSVVLVWEICITAVKVDENKILPNLNSQNSAFEAKSNIF